MDWITICSVAIGIWAMLSVLSGERMNRAQQMILASSDQTKAPAEIPIALGNDAALIGSPAAFGRKK